MLYQLSYRPVDNFDREFPNVVLLLGWYGLDSNTLHDESTCQRQYEGNAERLINLHGQH